MLSQLTFKLTNWSDGQVTFGAVPSEGITSKLHVAVFPLASVTVNTIFVVEAIEVPATGDCATEGLESQLSSGVAPLM